jgi:hypothetical protein
MQGLRVPSCKPCLSFRFLCWVLLALCSAPALCHADSLPRTLEVFLVGKLGQDRTFGERVTSWFDAKRFRVEVRRVPGIEPARVLAPSPERALTVWVSLEGTAAELYFAAPALASAGDREPRFLLRKLPLANGLDEIGAEHLAEILHLSALALLEGELSSERQDLERSLSGKNKARAAPVTTLDGRSDPDFSRPKEPGPERSPSHASFEFGLGYGVSFHSEEGVWHGPRASAEWFVGTAFGLALSAELGLPATHDLGELELRLQALQLILSAGFRRPLASGVAVEALAGPGLDIVDYRPERSPLAGVELGAGATEARPNLVAGFGLMLGRSALSLALLAELALSLSKTHYDLREGERERVIARPSPFAPRLGAELRF